MVGLLLSILTSWLLLWVFVRKSLAVLGFSFSKKRISDFLFGLFVSIVCCSAYFLAIIQFSKTTLTVNENFNGKQFLESSWWTLKSVLFEEIVFRGALLYIAIQKLGIRLACVLSATAFGIYHWFTYEIFGQPIQMLYVFIITGIAGLMFAYAFAKTKSLYLPIGLHLGWNLVTIVVFSQGPLGHQLLISSDVEKLGSVLSVAFFLYQILILPLIVLWYLRRKEQQTTNMGIAASGARR